MKFDSTRFGPIFLILHNLEVKEKNSAATRDDDNYRFFCKILKIKWIKWKLIHCWISSKTLHKFLKNERNIFFFYYSFKGFVILHFHFQTLFDFTSFYNIRCSCFERYHWMTIRIKIISIFQDYRLSFFYYLTSRLKQRKEEDRQVYLNKEWKK